MPRFVVLWHEAGRALGRPSHFDMLFEEESDARAWFAEQEIEPGIEIAVGELPRHRRHYFAYEGPVSRDRGTVSRWDAGEYRLLVSTESHFKVEVLGQRLIGVLTLSKIGDAWMLRYEPRELS